MSEPHHLEEGLARQRLNGVIPAGDRLQELQLACQPIANTRGCLGVGLQLGNALAQHHDGGINLAPLAAFNDDADDFPGILLRKEEIAPVAKGMGDLDEVPGEEFFQADADV